MPAKKVVAKKAVPAKKVEAKKVVPVKKVVAKKAAPTKKVVAKKAVPAKKVVASKVVPAKKVVAKKVEPAKKVVAKKVEPAKKVVAKKVEPAKKVVAKKVEPAKKVVAKKAAPTKKVEAKKPVPAPKKVKTAPIEVKPTKKVEAKLPKAEKVKPVKEVKPKKPSRPTSNKSKPTKTIFQSSRPAAPSQLPSMAQRASAMRVTEEKKPGIVVAHRRLDNKGKSKDHVGKTMMSYNPETTRSILDSHHEENKPKTVYRYSDEELIEFKELILKRLDAAKKELTYQQALITRKDEAGTEDTENRFNNVEDGSGAMEREQLAQLASRQIQFISHLEKALVRIENKTYGICRVTGKLIDKARLRAVPHATLSIEAKNNMPKK